MRCLDFLCAFLSYIRRRVSEVLGFYIAYNEPALVYVLLIRTILLKLSAAFHEYAVIAKEFVELVLPESFNINELRNLRHRQQIFIAHNFVIYFAFRCKFSNLRLSDLLCFFNVSPCSRCFNRVIEVW